MGFFRCVFLLLILAVGMDVVAQPCAVVAAPQPFPVKGEMAETATTPGNRGIVPDGFVSLPGGVSTIHGIDVSKWQPSADFVQAIQCGARFAYIRMSAGQSADAELEYRSHWANARSVNLLVGPYHNLTLIDSPTPFTTLTDAKKARTIKANETAARAQARLFIARLRETLQLDPDPSPQAADHHLGQPYLPIALDVSARPQNKGTAQDRAAFGRAYAAAICAWIDEVHQNNTFAGQTILLFTLPYVYKDYALARSDCGIDRLPVWLSYRPLDGDAPEQESNAQTRAAIAGLCGTGTPGNRCLLQQYTSWGGFALYNKTEGLDLDRFIGTETELHALLQQAVGPRGQP